MEIKISKKPVKYEEAIRYLEKKVKSLHSQKTEELLWILSHPSIYTAGISTKNNEILDKKINVIKEIRAITSLGFKEAKDLVEGAPKEVKTGVNKKEAEEIKQKLEAAGAKVELK